MSFEEFLILFERMNTVVEMIVFIDLLFELFEPVLYQAALRYRSQQRADSASNSSDNCNRYDVRHIKRPFPFACPL